MVGNVSSEQVHVLFWGEPSVHEQGEKAAVFPTHQTGGSLQLNCVIIPDSTVASYKCLYMGIE